MEERVIRVPVIKFQQKGITMYVGKMKAKDVLATWDVAEFVEEHLDAYQRQPYHERLKEIAKYLEECQVPIVPPILCSLRVGSKFFSTNEDVGILEIPLLERAVWVVDGQHRIGGFKTIQDTLRDERGLGRKKLSEEDASKLRQLLDFEIPLAFIDAESAVRRVQEALGPEGLKSMLEELNKESLEPEDVERVFFFIINKTQKSIRPSLKDTLMYLIASTGIKMPIIEKEEWRTKATPLVIELRWRDDSPLKGLINISGARGLGRPIQLASFVSSLEPLMTRNDKFRVLNTRSQLEYLLRFWEVIKEMYPDAFRADLRGQYLILRAIGVYTLNWLANDVYSWCRERGIEVPTKEDIRKFIEPLKDYDWKRDTSPLRGLGGRAGVEKAYKELLNEMATKGVDEASTRLKQLE